MLYPAATLPVEATAVAKGHIAGVAIWIATGSIGGIANLPGSLPLWLWYDTVARVAFVKTAEVIASATLALSTATVAPFSSAEKTIR